MQDPTRAKLLQFVEASAFSRYRDEYLDDDGIMIWLLTLFDKDEAADLTKGEKDQLRRAMETERAARNRRGEE